MYGSDHHSEEYLDYFGVTIKRTQYTDCKSLLKRLQSSFKTEIDNTPKPVVCKAKSEIKELSGSVAQLPEDKINNSHDTKYCTTVYSNDERLLSENGDSYSQGPKCFGTVALPVYDIMMKDLLSYVPASVHNVFNADNKNKTQLSENANSFSQGPDYFRAIEFPEYDIKLKEDVLPSVPTSPIDICTVNNNSEKQSSDDKASQNQSPESVCLTECEFKSKEILPPLLGHSNDSEPSTVDNNDKRQLSGDEDEETTWNFLYESFIKENEVLTDEDYSLVAKEENDACKTGVVDTVDKGKTTITKSVSDSCQIEEPTVLSKSYMLPYKSNNEEENKDNEDPKWKNYEKLRTDKERYHYARSRWRSMVIPNPNVDISSFMFKWKKAPDAKCGK
ncbi:hypothetical protein SK128_005801 [Halocaridina rubra]|uniref:Uncharacterized protein n=1 Tax=Halocaridina rubra TaxID=373956 RepID=A0AAN8WCE2_HALRR